jgi:hypothetical protein
MQKMGQNSNLLFAISLLAIVILWNCFNVDVNNSYSDFMKWGIYFFSVPLTYFIISIFSQPKSLITPIVSILFGVIISISLSRDLTNSFWFYKVLAASFGALVLWFSLYIIQRNKSLK